MEKMTFEKLASVVANQFREYMHEDGYDTFKDMCRSYDWEMSDIKTEVNTIITACANAAYDAGEDADFYMYDDHSYVQVGIDAITWGAFKKMVFALIK